MDFVVRFSESETLKRPGGVAQLGEHLPCKQGVKSSNLFISTRKSIDFPKGARIGKND